MKNEQDIGLIEVKCKCCGNVYMAHPLSNACLYSWAPGYGCDECKGEPSENDKLGKVTDYCEHLMAVDAGFFTFGDK